jgi:hypothetical protein
MLKIAASRERLDSILLAVSIPKRDWQTTISQIERFFERGKRGYVKKYELFPSSRL